MYPMALWFWSTVALGGFTLAGLAGGVSSVAPHLIRMSTRFDRGARRAALSLRDRADRVSRPSLSHHFDSLAPSSPSHPLH